MTDRPDPLAPPPGYGERHSGPPEPAGSSVFPLDTLCDWNDVPADPDARCALPRLWVLTMGDVNEHIVALDTCERHGIRFRHWVSMHCTVCTKATGRMVPMTLIRRQYVRPDGGLEDWSPDLAGGPAQEGIDSLGAKGWQR
jgi:hypothetical protein